MRLPFDKWLPDQDVYENPGVRTAKNVLPAKGGGFEPALDWQQWDEHTTTFVTFKPFTPYGTKWTDGTDLNLVAGNSNISSVTKAAVTSLTGTVSPTTTLPWDLTTFADFVIAVNPDQAPIKLDLTSTSNVFALCTGSPPSGAKTVGRVRDFLVLGNTTESATDYPSRVRWSGFNNPDLWGSDLSTQADFQDMQSRYGGVQKIVPGSVGYIFQESAITRMSYIGPPVIFRFDTVSEDLGTIAGNSIIWTDKRCFFYSQNGFQMMDMGSGQITPIGTGRIDDWFLAELDADELGEMQGAIDNINKRAIWAFKSTGYAGTAQDRFDTFLIYDWSQDGWSYIQTINCHAIGSFELSGDTRDSTYVVYKWNGVSVHELGFLDGSELDGQIVTGDFGVDNTLMYIDGARPIVETGASAITTLTVRCNYRNNVLQSPTADGNTGDVAVNAIGRADFRVNARYARFNVKTSGVYLRIRGIEFDAIPSNKR